MADLISTLALPKAVWKTVLNNKRIVMLTILFDLLSVVSFYTLVSMIGITTTFESFTLWIAKTSVRSLVFIVVQLLLALAVYSFFKYAILNTLQGLRKKEPFDLRYFPKFYALNLILAGVGGVLFILITLVLMITHLKLLIWALVILCGVGMYFFVQQTQVIIITKKYTLRDIFIVSVSKKNRLLCGKLMMYNGALILILSALLLISGTIVDYTLFKPGKIELEGIAIITIVMMLCSMLCLYALHLFNRIALYITTNTSHEKN